MLNHWQAQHDTYGEVVAFTGPGSLEVSLANPDHVRQILDKAGGFVTAIVA